VVQRIDRFEAQLELNPLPKSRILDYRQIQVVRSIRANSREAGTQNPQVLAGLQPGISLESRTGIKPAVHRASTIRNRMSQISQEDRISSPPAHRLPLINPEACQPLMIREANPFQDPPTRLSPAQRQFINCCHNQRCVRSWSEITFRHQIPTIQVRTGFQSFDHVQKLMR
jgi:hypothetical protein